MKAKFFSICLLVALLTSCTATTTVAPTPASTLGMANPASVYCEQQGFKSEIRTTPDGSQSGVCIFPDGSECDEWAYFRGECASATASSADHTPVILRVEEREETQNGELILTKDIYFTDAEGDATTVVNTLVSTDPPSLSLSISDDTITTPVDQQKQEGKVTSAMACPMVTIPFSLTIEDRIRDMAGNLSEPITVTFACPANPPNSIPFLIIAVVIGAGLMAGFWLYFRKRTSDGKYAALATLRLVCILFFSAFIGSILHEGGHALLNLILGKGFEILYIHPFTFTGFARPFTDNAWFHAGGYLVVLPVSFVILCLLWKRRSINNLPLLILFPLTAIGHGFLLIIMMGDIGNILRLTGWPPILFIVSGIVLTCVGLLLFLALFPLFGFAPTDKQSLLIIPTAFYLYGIVGWLVAHWLVPGSPIDLRYLLGAEIIMSANTQPVFLPLLTALIAALYITLYRKIQPRLPAWLQTETVTLTWNDLRLPAALAAICIVIGLLII